MCSLQTDSEQALLNLHQDCLAEENLVVQEKEDLRAQLQETESNYLAIIANMKVVSRGHFFKVAWSAVWLH